MIYIIGQSQIKDIVYTKTTLVYSFIKITSKLHLPSVYILLSCYPNVVIFYIVIFTFSVIFSDFN